MSPSWLLIDQSENVVNITSDYSQRVTAFAHEIIPERVNLDYEMQIF
jgi:hypothetical protein